MMRHQGWASCALCDDDVDFYYVAVRGEKKKKVCQDCREEVVKLKPTGTYSSRESQGLFCQTCTKVGKVFVMIEDGQVASNSLCRSCIDNWLKNHEW